MMPPCSPIKYGTPEGLNDESRISAVSEAEETPEDITKTNSSHFPLYMRTTYITRRGNSFWGLFNELSWRKLSDPQLHSKKATTIHFVFLLCSHYKMMSQRHGFETLWLMPLSLKYKTWIWEQYERACLSNKRLFYNHVLKLFYGSSDSMRNKLFWKAKSNKGKMRAYNKDPNAQKNKRRKI